MEHEFKPSSFLFSLIALIASFFFFMETLGISTLGKEWGGPRLFPSLISFLLLVVSSVLVFLDGVKLFKYLRSYNIAKRWVSIKFMRLKEVLPIMFLMIFIVIYVRSIERVGYFIPTFMISLYTSLLFRARFIDAVVVALIASLGSALLFKVILKVPLPEGVLGW